MHYTIMIIGDNPEEQLEPFSEHLEVPVYIDEDGEKSTWNPKGEWDWYVLGGRWSGMIELKKGKTGKRGEPGVGNNPVGIDQARRGDIANFDKIETFAILKNGEWYDRGWDNWDDNSPQYKEWQKKIKELKKDISENTLISIYDCHT